MMTPNKPTEKEAEPLADIENHHVAVAENEETTAAENEAVFEEEISNSTYPNGKKIVRSVHCQYEKWTTAKHTQTKIFTKDKGKIHGQIIRIHIKIPFLFLDIFCLGEPGVGALKSFSYGDVSPRS